MKIGLQITESDLPVFSDDAGEKLAQIAKTADDMGFHSLWLPDHLFNAMSIFGLPVDAPKLEGYATISYLAAVTRRIKLGLLVTCNVFRHPGLLVKTVSTIDVLSGGRAYLGIGAGWFEREAKGLGIPFPSMRERFERLEETLQIAHQMWRDDTSPFNGKYCQLAEPINSPQPLSKPHPPILIGGSGEKKTLRLIAKYGDACNFFVGSPLEELPASFRKMYENRLDFLRRKLSILKQHCDDAGRLHGEIEKTAQVYIKVAPNAQRPSEVIALCRELADLGIEHVIFNMLNTHEVESLKIMGNEVIPIVADFKVCD